MARKMTFNIDGLIGLNAKGMISSLDSIKRGLSNLSGKEVDKLGGLLMKATEQTKEFEMAAKRTFKDTSEIKTANKAYAGLEKTLKQIDFIMANSDFGAGSAKIQKVLKAGKQEIEGLQRISQEFSKTMNETFAKFKGQHNIRLTADDLIEASMSLENIGRQVAVLTRSSNALKIDTTELDEAKATLEELGKTLAEKKGIYAVEKMALDSSSKTLSPEVLQRETANLAALKQEVEQLGINHTAARREVTELEKKMKAASVTIEEQKKKNAELIDTLKATSAEYIKMQESIDLGKIFGEEFGPLVDDLPNTMEGIAQAIERISNSSELIRTDALKHMGEAAKDLGAEMKTAGTELDGINESLREMTELEKQVDSLQNSMMQFFSLTSGWRLLQRAMKEAHKTVQELDAAMTEIAVVSEYSLDAIWAMRQGFTDAATDMGAKTLDLINATKLYVQQGLDLVDAQKIGIETIKMARIANLDGAEATSLMTAAIRGFHMELTEANKVNDVYSVLAAKSAADTREIAVAMSKTASIASNAGSEFESMSAFLTQIIETTREAPQIAA